MRRLLVRLRRRLRRNRLFLFIAVLGPGIIAAFGGNDPSGIYGYSLAGAQYGYSLLWVLLFAGLSLGICQEMGARMGAVTGKGLADLIREEYGVRVTLFAMVALLIANFATTVSEFAGIAAAIQIFTPPPARLAVKWTVLPLIALGIWLLVTRGSYKRVERILLSASLIYIAYVVSAFMAHPPWGEVLSAVVHPSLAVGGSSSAYVFTIINIMGTTITPWAQFYIQSSVRDRATTAEEYTPLDPIGGAISAILVAFFIAVCCAATVYVPGKIPDFNDAGQIALALKPAAGALATTLFGLGLLNAACFGAITVPLSTAYAVTESLGWESGLGRRVREAPLFIGVFTFLIVVSLLVVLLGGENLAFLIILPNIVGGILLPIILILLLRLINNPRLMGKYKNSVWQNGIAILTTGVMILLSVLLIIQGVLPH
jgi:Mn2+/Fe2+ NRAMP family transporter